MRLKYGQTTIEIDDSDWDMVKMHLWYWTKQGMRTRVKGQNVLLARFLVSAKPNEVVKFGPLGNKCYRRSNLRVVSRDTISPVGVARGVQKLPSGRYSARRWGKYLGTFDTLEQASRAYSESKS